MNFRSTYDFRAIVLSPNLSSRSLSIFSPLLPSALCFSLLTPDWKMSGGGARVSIPASVKKTIQSIKEVVEKHDDYEIYAMLKECAMDRDEAVHRLLLLGLSRSHPSPLWIRLRRGGLVSDPREVGVRPADRP